MVHRRPRRTRQQGEQVVRRKGRPKGSCQEGQGRANVPVFVLEFLLGKYCASSDEIAIQMGMQVVNDTLANNYIRPDESAKAQSKVKESGKYSFIDKVKVRLVDSDYWAEGVNFNNKFLHIPSQYVRDYERLLMGVSGRKSRCASKPTRSRRAKIHSGSTSSSPFRSRPSTSMNIAMSASSFRRTSGSISSSGAWGMSPARCLNG